MNNFEFCSATRLVFGRDEEKRIGQLMLEKIASGAKVLLVSGGGSAERSGLLKKVRDSLAANGFRSVEISGVTPNPELSFVREGIELARDEKCQAVLAVGGGSVIDAAKAIAVGVPYSGDVWDFFTFKGTPKEALPVACVLTLPAAGSEQSIRCVITNEGRKLGMGSPVVRPFVSVIDPALFMTLPEKQIRAGVIDMMSHIMERYFTQTPNTDFINGQAEAAMRSIMKAGLELRADSQNYDAWCQIGLAGTFAHNGYFGLGQVEDWACHGMEHELSAWKTEITHGEGLAVVTPAWMQYVWPANPDRFEQFAVNVMGQEKHESQEKTILAGIEALRNFYRKMGAPTTLGEINASEAPLEELAAKAVQLPGKLGNFKPLYKEDILKIYQSMH